MTDEKKIASDSEGIENTANAADAPSPKKKGKKKWAIIGGVVGVIVVAAVGLWVWHSDPGFCNNPVCHGDLTRQELTQRTANLSFNPHAWQHEQNQCSDCHKSHRASTVMCTECHAEAKAILPDGWVDSAKAKAIEQAIYA